MRKKILLLCASLMILLSANAQRVALKTNALYWFVATPNLQLELKLAPRASVDFSAAYNPWTFKDNKALRFWLVQPEARYWFCEAFEGHFIGLHLHGAQYYHSGWSDKIYDGYLAGGGISYGYDWILSPHWNIEATLGVGYARLWYKEMPDAPCIKCFDNKHKNYWGVTRIGFTLSYLF